MEISVVVRDLWLGNDFMLHSLVKIQLVQDSIQRS